MVQSSWSREEELKEEVLRGLAGLRDLDSESLSSRLPGGQDLEVCGEMTIGVMFIMHFCLFIIQLFIKPNIKY